MIAVPTLSREQAAASVTAAVAERDTIQQNLLELDNSFGKRLLAGATLTGETSRRWEGAAAGLTSLWETFTAYSAAVDRAAEIQAALRRSAGPQLAEISTLLHGTSIQLTRAPTAATRGDLTSTGVTMVTMTTAIREMKRTFAAVTDVVAAAEAVWNEVADALQRVGADLTAAGQQAGGLGDDTLAGAVGAAETELGQLRDTLNHDPLALWRNGQVDGSRVTRLRDRAAAAVTRSRELAALRENSGRRIAAVTAVVTAARSAWQDAMAARSRAAAKIAAGSLPTPPDVHGLVGRLAALDALTAEGRWTRLDSELDLIEKQATVVAKGCRDTEQEAAALLDRREELRGLLDAYQARAAKLGGAEDSGLDARYAQAHTLLWTAPCDLTAAADAVTSYQQAVLSLRDRERRG